MPAAEQVTSHSHNVTPPSEAVPTCSRRRGRGREDSSLFSRLSDRRSQRVPRETERRKDGQPAGKAARTPWREDLPSPWCVWQDYRDGAAHYAGEAAVRTWAYWLFAVPPLLLNMAVAWLHTLTQRPARGWGALLILTLIITTAVTFG